MEVSMDLKQVRSDVDAMNKVLGRSSQDDATDPPGTTAPKTTAPTTEPPNELKTDSPGTEAPKTSTPKTSTPTTEAPMDEKDKLIADLRTQLNEKELTPKTKVPTTNAPLNIEEQDFVGEIDLTDLTKEELNKLLNKVFSHGVATSVSSVRTILPGTITTEVETMNSLKKVNEDFYAANEDLKSFQKVVATVFGELATADPKKTMTDVLKETAPEVRRRLGLPEPKSVKKQQSQQQNRGRDNNPPKLPGKKGKSGRSSDSKPVTGVAAELDAMNNSIGR